MNATSQADTMARKRTDLKRDLMYLYKDLRSEYLLGILDSDDYEGVCSIRRAEIVKRQRKIDNREGSH